MSEETGSDSPQGRRAFIWSASTIAMAGGLAGSYGTFAVMAGRFLYPSETGGKAWQFVAEAHRIALGDAMMYQVPDGSLVTITRQGSGMEAKDFLALSSICPHLGCRVHWESHKKRFFCPCHNGIFDPGGSPVSGPPAEAGQTLPKYPLKIDSGLLFIEVPLGGESGVS